MRLPNGKRTRNDPQLLVDFSLRGTGPAEIEGTLVLGLELSPSIASQVSALAENVLGELERWGIQPQKRVR